MNPTNILVTGGCGFLGRHLLQRLIREFPGAQINVLDLEQNPSPHFDFENHEKVRLLSGIDVRDFKSISTHFSDVDLVIHCAGIVSFSRKDRDLLQSVNVLGTKNVVQASVQHDVKLFIQMSSVAALGFNDEPEHPVNETFVFDWDIAGARKKYYMLTKHLSDQVVKEARKTGLRSVILYAGGLFGPGDITNTGKLLKETKRRSLPFNIPGGTNVVDVRDVARGIIAVLNRDKPGEDYLLSGYNLTYKEYFNIIKNELEITLPRFTTPKWLNTPLYYVALTLEAVAGHKIPIMADAVDNSFRFRYYDNSKAKRDLAWEPRIPFHESIRDAVKWMEVNGFLES